MTVSIIIPVFNDPEGLHTTLQSLRPTTADEIVIVDNGSDDATPCVAAEAVVEHPRRSTTEELRKLMRVGRGHAELQRRYPERYGRPYRPPPTDGPSADGDVDPLKMSAKGIGWLSGAIRG